MGRLSGKIAVVTGSGNGIGRATIELFAAEGAIVYVTDVDGEAAKSVAEALTAQGYPAIAMTVDVSRGQDVAHLFRTVDKDHGKLDILINNAGVNARSEFRHMTDADWTRVREVNLDGVVRVARDGFPLLQKSGNGSLVNIASLMGHQPIRQIAAYATTKGAVQALTRALAIEYAAFGVRVNTVSPGFVETAMTARITRNPLMSKGLLDKAPMRRYGLPIEIAKAALFFASDDSSYCTGADLVVDGGMAAGL